VGKLAGKVAIVTGASRTRAKSHTDLGMAYLEAGNVAVALEEGRQALRDDANYGLAYNLMGLAHMYLGEKPQARENFERALRLSSNDPDINNNYGWFLCQVGRETEAIPYFQKAIKNPLYTTPDLAYANAGSCAIKADDLEGAENYLTSAIRLNGSGGVVARVHMANLQYAKGNLVEARRVLSEALRAMEPPTPQVLWLALRIERKLGNREAESVFAAQLRGRYQESKEYQEFLKGNFE
jgi:type IV pilus assembly protein PilF